MSPAIAAILTVATLGVWHLRTRRHPGWSASATGRFCITSAYPVVAIAVFWLVQATTTEGWEWAFGNLWALAAMVMFVRGFDALRETCEEQKRASRRIETISSPGRRPHLAPGRSSVQ